jgi:uncharacterized membrane protein YgcG
MSPIAPICVTVEAVDLVNGATLASRQECFGADAGPLGVVAVDPSEALDAACEGESYVCALDPRGIRWDPEACTPWDDDGGSADGGSADGGSADGGSADGGDDSDGSGGGSGCRSANPIRVARLKLVVFGVFELRWFIGGCSVAFEAQAHA